MRCKKKKHRKNTVLGLPARIRTADLQSRSLTRYPAVPQVDIKFSEFATRVWLFGMRCVTAKGKCAVLVWQYTAGRYAESCALSSYATSRCNYFVVCFGVCHSRVAFRYARCPCKGRVRGARLAIYRRAVCRVWSRRGLGHRTALALLTPFTPVLPLRYALSSCATGRYSVSLSLRERWHVIRDGEGNSVTISYVTTLIFYHFSTLLST